MARAHEVFCGLFIASFLFQGVTSSSCDGWSNAMDEMRSLLVDASRDLSRISQTVRSHSDRIKYLEVEMERQINNSAWPPEWKFFEGSCYRLNKNLSMNWQNARNACLGLQADMAISRSAEINSFFGRMLVQNGVPEAWLGGTDNEEEGSWKWVDGTLFYRRSNQQLGYNNFGSGEPNNNWNTGSENCLVMYRQLTWNDVPCNLRAPYFCQLRLS